MPKTEIRNQGHNSSW